MARPLKVSGLTELRQLQKRARRQFAAKRISKADFEYINGLLEDIEVRIVEMTERDEYGREM